MQLPPNHFLQSLGPGDFELLRPHLREVRLNRSATLFEVGGTIERVYFPHDAVISLIVPLATGDMVEAGIIGRDGVLGTSAAFDGPTALNQAVVQIPGTASSIDAGSMRAALSTSKSLQAKLYQRDQLLLAHAQQAAACNAKHQIEERLCRWLLRIRDLVNSDRLELTQEFLGQMLGVRRTSVTLAARHLQVLNLIKYRRGQIDILDHEALEEASCECYEALKIQAERLGAEPDDKVGELVRTLGTPPRQIARPVRG